MATVVAVAQGEPLQSLEMAPLKIPERVHVADHDSEERASPIQKMSSVPRFRFRAVKEQPTATLGGNEESPTSSGGTLPPDSIGNLPQSQDSEKATAWHQFLGWVPSALFPGGDETKSQQYQELHGYNRIKRENVDSYPNGFPRLSAYMNSDEDVALFRRFGQSHTRLLNHLQVEITVLEKEILELDKADDADESTRQRLRNTIQNGRDIAQRKLLKQMQTKLNEYDEMLVNYSNILALGSPPKRNYMSLFNWVWNRKPLHNGYYDFVFHIEDFVSVARRSEQSNALEKSRYVEDCIQSYLTHVPKSAFKKFFITPTETAKTSDLHTTYYSRTQLSKAAKVFTVALAVGILLMPVFLLFLLPMSRREMAAVVLVFVLAFSGIMSIVADGRVQEVFVGTAAYAAVLATFLGNMSSGSGLGQ